jgi:pimeloyl-ACP methyl ester carboxylesterase
MIWPLLGGAAAVAGAGLALFTRSTAKKVEAALPPDGDFADIDGNRIHYVDQGSGPALVLIHGLAGQMRNFAKSLVEDLAKDHRVILVDRPGSGHSVRAPGASARLRVQAEVIAGLIRHLGLERPMLVGHSLGGALSLTVAANHPELVSGLALVAPLTQVQENVPPAFRGLIIGSAAARKLVAWTVATPMGIWKSKEIVAQVFAPEPVPADFALAGGGALGLRPSAFEGASADISAINEDLPGVVERYGSLNLPVAILYGREDNLLDYRIHGERTAGAIPGAHIDVVEGGHMLPFTKPEETARFIRAAAARGGETGRGEGSRS